MSTIEKLFKRAKMLYKQVSNTFYVSSTDILLNGEHTYLHKAILQPFVQKSFTEYRPGNIEDLKYLYDKASSGVFQSLYCSMCASSKPDNVIQFTPNAVVAQNPSAEIREKITMDGKNYFITGTTPRYLYNHLLLFPEDHISSYLFMLSRPHFISLYKILETHGTPNTKFIFNGNFGSDIYHAHVHVTDQNFSIINEFNRIIKSPRGALPIRGPVVNAIAIHSPNINELYEEIANYFMLYFSPGFDKTRMFLSANLFITTYENTKIYAAILIIGDLSKKSLILSKSCTLNCIIPGYVLNFTSCDDVAPEDIVSNFKSSFIDPDSFLKERKRLNLTLDGKRTVEEGISYYFNEIIKTGNEIPSEVYQWSLFSFPTFTINTAMCTKMENYVSHMVKDPEMCTKRLCPPIVFASYKILLTIWILCLIEKIQDKSDLSLLYTSFPIQSAAIYGELHNLTQIHNIRSFENLIIKGSLSSATVRHTFKNLLRTTFSVKSKSWIDYNFSQIGDVSAFGVITKSKLQSTNSSFVIKINKGANPDAFVYEAVAGIELSHLRNNIPNFVMVYGSFQCASPEDYSNLCIPNPLSKNKEMQYILMEYLEGKSFQKYISSLTPQEAPMMLAGIAQTMLGLYYAQLEKKFTHYDFHAANNFVCETGEHYYEYYIGDKVYTIYAPFTTVVIDYGTAHVSGPKKYYVDSYLRNKYGITTDIYKKTADCYSILIHSLFILILYNPSLIYTTIVQKLYIKIQHVYKDLFSVPLFQIVTDIRRMCDSMQDPTKCDNYARTYFNNHRKDKSYYLYVPRDYDNNYGPLEVYTDIVDILNSEGLGYIVSRPTNSTIPVCRWGNIPKDVTVPRGCEITLPDYVKSMSVKIEKLKTKK